MITLNTEQAQYCAGVFNDYFGQFDRIDQYMRDQKTCTNKKCSNCIARHGSGR